MRNLKWCALIKSQGTNEPSLSKIATLIAYVCATFFFCRHNWLNGFNETQWLIYLAIPAGHNLIGKKMTLTSLDNQYVADTKTVPDSNNPQVVAESN